jgi:esterase/lipase
MKSEVHVLSVGIDDLKTTLFVPESKFKNIAVLFLHGWTGRPNERAAEILANEGYSCLTVVFRGHPGSSKDISSVSRADALEDAVAGYDFLKSKIDKNCGIATPKQN